MTSTVKRYNHGHVSGITSHNAWLHRMKVRQVGRKFQAELVSIKLCSLEATAIATEGVGQASKPQLA